MTRRTLLCVIMCSFAAAFACRGKQDIASLKELQRTRSGEIDVVLLARAEALKQGKDAFVLEFRRADGALVDVGTVRANATMTMAGMGPMLGSVFVHAGGAKGRYDVSSDLSMAGTWRITVEWDGPSGKGSASFPGTVR